ncbi:MAG TPA: GNAT family N-acetyltransferase [Acidimicrobiales bacterium]|nr:GNAT family N-acetyltransferase [Acidimicrobiales bacterium]
MTAVRKATYADVPALSAALARAFEDDPIFEWLLPPGRTKRRMDRLTKSMEVALRVLHLSHDSTWTTPDLAGAAVWDPPDKWKTGPRDMLRGVPAMAWVLRGRLLPGIRALSAVERKHPPGSHWYLAILGTEPAAQGKGVGTALLEPVLRQCDERGEEAFLESSKERNVPYYARFGFEVVGEVQFPDGGPTVWQMLRQPRS